MAIVRKIAKRIRRPRTITPVIFRKWRAEDHGIIAIFPTLPGTNDPYTCMMYEHVGQHGSGDPQGVIGRTSLATRREYGPLLRELHSIGYRSLKVIARYRHDFVEVRRRAINKSRRA